MNWHKLTAPAHKTTMRLPTGKHLTPLPGGRLFFMADLVACNFSAICSKWWPEMGNCSCATATFGWGSILFRVVPLASFPAFRALNSETELIDTAFLSTRRHCTRPNMSLIWANQSIRQPHRNSIKTPGNDDLVTFCLTAISPLFAAYWAICFLFDKPNLRRAYTWSPEPISGEIVAMVMVAVLSSLLKPHWTAAH